MGLLDGIMRNKVKKQLALQKFLVNEAVNDLERGDYQKAGEVVERIKSMAKIDYKKMINLHKLTPELRAEAETLIRDSERITRLIERKASRQEIRKYLEDMRRILPELEKAA